MLVTIMNEAYKGIEGYCRDSAFTAADPEQPMLVWATENDMEIGENEKYTVLRKELVGAEPPQQDEVLPDIVYNIPNVTSDVSYSVGMVVDVLVRGTIQTVFDAGFTIESKDDDLFLEVYTGEDCIREVRIISKPLPPVEVGKLYSLTFRPEAHQFATDGVYILSADNEWIGTGKTGYAMHLPKDHPDIKSITEV